MFTQTVRTLPEDIDTRLEAFGLKKSDFYPLVQAVAAAKMSTIGADAAAASGLQAWLAGVRHLNLMMLPLGWEQGRNDGVEEIKDPASGVSFVYQTVDQACSIVRGPRAISGKGPAADRMVEEAQKTFFGDHMPEALPATIRRIDYSVWFICVSVNETGICAELSLPVSIENNNFKHFAERIFIIGPGEWGTADISTEPEPPAPDYTFKLLKK